MNEGRIKLAEAYSVIALTKHIMNINNCMEAVAFGKLLGSELYKLLTDEETGLYLEKNEYICDCYDAECISKSKLYDMISTQI